jgi:hypothetical protein
MFQKSYSQKKGDIAAARGTRLGIRERNPSVMLPNIVVGSTHYNVIHIITLRSYHEGR